MISRDILERKQVWVYVVALLIAAGFGLLCPEPAARMDYAISPVIAVLMYGMFSQIPFFQLKAALDNRRFLYALMVVNFMVVPVLVFGLTRFLPDNPTLHLGVFLVLLTPCIDYVIVFTHLGKGDEKLVLISTPLLFIAQMLLLPCYLWLFMGKEAAAISNAGPFLEAFFVLIFLPLVLALLSQWWVKQRANRQGFLTAAAWLPVPFMALTLFLVVASQIATVYASFDVIRRVIPLYLAYMTIVPFAAYVVARVFRLKAEAGRALLFSAGTRNSLVVLPLALALPEPMNGLVAAVIVTQTIVEIVGELVYIRLIPRFVVQK